MDNAQFTAKNQPDLRAIEQMREQDFPKEEIVLLREHVRTFDPLTTFCMKLGLRYAESESVLWANHSDREIHMIESELSIIESCEKMVLPKTVTERPEYWEVKAYTRLFLKSKMTRARNALFTNTATVQRSEVLYRNAEDKERTLLDQTGGEINQATGLGAIPRAIRGAIGGARKR
jgi:hypothetical protein